MSLTIQVLTRDNDKIIKSCLTSLEGLEAEILVGDLGSKDNTIEICQNHGARVIPIPWYDNYSEARNALLVKSTTEWQFYIEPWEKIDSGKEQILWAMSQSYDTFNIYSLQNKILTKSTRLWRKSHKFVLPVYEYLEAEDPPLLDCILIGSPPNRFEETIKILEKWKQQSPQVANIEYYIALTYLTHGFYDEFIRHAKEFLFKSKETNVLMHYYCAVVELKFKGNVAESINHILCCLIQEPTLAEFWCLLGDIFFHLKQWRRAICFYDNAILFGSRRLQTDEYPINISKYKNYPEQMMKDCEKLLKDII